MSHLTLISAVLLLPLPACADGSAPARTGLTAPALQTPRTEIPIRLNDPTTGCTFSPTHGYGFQVAFTWNPVADAAHYHLRLHHLGAQDPILDTVVDEPSYLLLQCNAYASKPIASAGSGA